MFSILFILGVLAAATIVLIAAVVVKYSSCFIFILNKVRLFASPVVALARSFGKSFLSTITTNRWTFGGRAPVAANTLAAVTTGEVTNLTTTPVESHNLFAPTCISPQQPGTFQDALDLFAAESNPSNTNSKSLTTTLNDSSNATTIKVESSPLQLATNNTVAVTKPLASSSNFEVYQPEHQAQQLDPASSPLTFASYDSPIVHNHNPDVTTQVAHRNNANHSSSKKAGSPTPQSDGGYVLTNYEQKQVSLASAPSANSSTTITNTQGQINPKDYTLSRVETYDPKTKIMSTHYNTSAGPAASSSYVISSVGRGKASGTSPQFVHDLRNLPTTVLPYKKYETTQSSDGSVITNKYIRDHHVTVTHSAPSSPEPTFLTMPVNQQQQQQKPPTPSIRFDDNDDPQSSFMQNSRQQSIMATDGGVFQQQQDDNTTTVPQMVNPWIPASSLRLSAATPLANSSPAAYYTNSISQRAHKRYRMQNKYQMFG